MILLPITLARRTTFLFSLTADTLRVSWGKRKKTTAGVPRRAWLWSKTLVRLPGSRPDRGGTPCRAQKMLRNTNRQRQLLLLGFRVLLALLAWFPGSLVRWFPGSLVPWFAGSMVRVRFLFRLRFRFRFRFPFRFRFRFRMCFRFRFRFSFRFRFQFFVFVSVFVSKFVFAFAFVSNSLTANAKGS